MWMEGVGILWSIWIEQQLLDFACIATYLIVKGDENEKRAKSSCSEGVEGLEEEDELEVLGNLLEFWAKRRDGDELGSVKNESKDDHWNDEAKGFVILQMRFFLEGLHFIIIYVCKS